MTRQEAIEIAKTCVQSMAFYSEKPQTGAYVIQFFGKTAIRFPIKKNSEVIELQGKHFNKLASNNISCNRLANDWVQCELKAMNDTELFKEIVTSAYFDMREASVSEPFGCCNFFNQCSDRRACLYPDDIFYIGCMYRRNLEAGRIFYGKNANNKKST